MFQIRKTVAMNKNTSDTPGISASTTDDKTGIPAITAHRIQIRFQYARRLELITKNPWISEN
ncbi:hypothetical protein CMV30_04405 [Nibricoccus aquaticus]|uniref:Uncharacterized protein n=1 Tax=Nibricoccus aquaticus TaxID=2576891 RepID=A0A290Q3K8_9BACT|nr:hypothetical protein CMV30_04405 [Nibricoccus aquaticus]